MAEERELILKLGQKITDRIGHKVTVEDPEYYGLACVVTDEMAEIALKMKVRKPMTLDQVAKATGKSKKYLEPLLQEACWSIIGRTPAAPSSMCCLCSYPAAPSSLI